VLHILAEGRGVRVELLELIGDGSVVICLSPPDLEPRLDRLHLQGEVLILEGNDGGLLLRVKLDVLGGAPSAAGAARLAARRLVLDCICSRMSTILRSSSRTVSCIASSASWNLS
jgi:hypothetical protein